MQIRKLRFRISGGFAGLVRGTEVEGGLLSASERAALAQLLTAASPSRATNARDLLTYECEVDTDEGTRRFELDELNVPKALAGLLSKLTKKSRPVTP